MILVGNQRGGGKNLALHLLKEENERVEVHQLRGFVGETLISALQESYALSRATKCRQHLFSLSLNPPPEEDPDNQVFEEAVDRIERRLGLDGQPRAIVFHEKEGRRHAHAVWCRIDAGQMKAVPLPFTRQRLQEVARELYIEHDWRMPDGFIDKELRDPRNFTLAEWQQAKRAQKDPRRLKAQFQEAWTLSDSKVSFEHALKERGFILAKGDRRGFVAVDHTGEAYAVSRWVGLKAKQVAARLGSTDDLPSVPAAHAKAAGFVTVRLEALRAEQVREAAATKAEFDARRERLERQHAAQRKALAEDQRHLRQLQEAEQRHRFRTGLLGFLDRVTGRHRRVAAENQLSAAKLDEVNSVERCALAERQGQARSALQERAEAELRQRRSAAESLTTDIDALQNARRRAERADHTGNKGAERRKRQRIRDGP
ncbi:MAG: relaxase/mobilization nuclease domain-containing protein [Pseudomonadota bacterium]